MSKVTIENIEEIDRSTWPKLKEELLDIQREFKDRNGLRCCKNCGMDYRVLVEDIEKLMSKDKCKEEEKCCVLCWEHSFPSRSCFSCICHSKSKDKQISKECCWNCKAIGRQLICNFKEGFKDQPICPCHSKDTESKEGDFGMGGGISSVSKQKDRKWNAVCTKCNLIFSGYGELICPECETSFKQEDNWQERFDQIVVGMDQDEVSHPKGWWETSTGAEFGRKKRQEIKDFIQTLLDKKMK